MHFSIAAFVGVLATTSIASPIGTLDVRAVDKLDPEATAEAHQRDNTATRAISNSAIKTSDGKCLFVDALSGDFRANLTPIQIGTCDGSAGQKWDVLTSGIHNNVAGSALIVSTLTQACFDFNPSRNDRVSLFSCGGRAAGEGKVTNSQLFAFNGGNGPLQFRPDNQKNSCFTVNGNAIAIAPCADGNQNQLFTFGGAAAGGVNAGNGANQGGAGKATTTTTTTAAASATATAQPEDTGAACKSG